MSSVMYLLSEFRDQDAVAAAIHSLRAVGVADSDMDLFSEEPVEFPRGVLDRPSRMSFAAVSGAIMLGVGATAFVWFAQNNYALDTGGMPVFSFWGTGVITYEMTMLGAVLSTFGYFLWESGIIRKCDKTAPVPVVPPECICLRVRCATGDVAGPTALLCQAGANSVQEKAPL
jgi:ActD protein